MIISWLVSLFHVFIHLSSQSQSLISSSHRLLLPAPQQSVAYIKGRDWFDWYANNSDPHFYHVSRPQLQIPCFLSRHLMSFPLKPLFVMNPGSKYKQWCGFLRGRAEVFQGAVQGKHLRCQCTHLSLLIQIVSEAWCGRKTTGGMMGMLYFWGCGIFCYQLGSNQWQKIDQENQIHTLLSFNKERKAPIRILFEYIYSHIYIWNFITPK